jgi:DNA-binding response OmpR family regulator
VATILIVDDEEIHARAARPLPRPRAGTRARWSRRPRRRTLACASVRPQLVLLDCASGEVDGLETLREMKSSTRRCPSS